MISIDDRIGSREMLPRLRALGCEVELTRMSFGDISFYGNGIGSVPVSIGLEIKEVHDVVQCITSGRFAGHQLPGLIKSYDYVWLLINGQYRSRAKDGVLELYREGKGGGWYWQEVGGDGRGKRWLWRDVESWLSSMSVMGGIRIQHCRDWTEGAQWIKQLHSWFSKDTHKSHMVMYGGKELYCDQALLMKPSLVRRLASELPRIGSEKSIAVAAHFHSVSEMMAASEKEWTEIDGIGRGIAKIVYKAIHNSNNGNGNGGKH